MPGQPGPSTTVIVPAGAFTAPSLRTAWRAASSAIGDCARLARRFLEILERNVVGVGVAGARSGKGPDPGPLAHVAGGFFHRPFLELQLLVHTILEVDVGIVGASEEVRAEDALEKAAGNVEAIGEEALGACASKLSHSSVAS